MGGVHSPKEYRRVEHGIEIGQYVMTRLAKFESGESCQ